VSEKTSEIIKKNIFEKFCKIDKRNRTLMTPFVVSEEKKTLYFHIAKTGGSSITHLLQRNGLNDNILTNKNGSFESKKKYFKRLVENWDDYYKFTFIRNKYDQLISLYNYDRQLLSGLSFEKFVKNHLQKRSSLYPLYDYWIDQHFLTTVNDKSIFDFVGYFENYEDDLKFVCHNIGIKYEDIRSNLGSYDRSKKSSYYTPELKLIVDTKFSKEVEYFKWELNL